MNNSNAYDDFYNHRQMKSDYTATIEYINQAIFESPLIIEEYLFIKGLEFCKDLPEFYPDCQCFWDAYTKFYYESVEYYLNTYSIKNAGTRYKKIKDFTANINKRFEITTELREDIFIEYNHGIDAKFLLKKNNATKEARKNLSNLKSI